MLKILLRPVFLLICLSLIQLYYSPSATALLRQHHQSIGGVRYHSQVSLQDKQGMAWQVLVFPDEASSNYYLRLVGFPGEVEFIHPQPLEMLTAKGQLLTLNDVLTDDFLANNVGQYDFTSVVETLPLKGGVKLSVPLQSNILALKIPADIVQEWRLLLTEIEDEQ